MIRCCSLFACIRSARVLGQVLSVALMLALPVLSLHAEPTVFADPAKAGSSSVAGGITQSILALGLVLLVMFALVALLKRWQLPGGSVRGGMKVAQGLSLGAKEWVVLLQVDGRRFLIGVAAGQVNLLTELDKAELPPDAAEPVTTLPTSFAALLQRVVGKSQGTPS